MWLKALFLFQKFSRVYVCCFRGMLLIASFRGYVVEKNEDIRLFYDCKW